MAEESNESWEERGKRARRDQHWLEASLAALVSSSGVVDSFEVWGASMRYFERAELARRYHSHRPRVHSRVVQEIASLRPARSVEAALDVACGTGHSTHALAPLAPAVCGCDVSSAMLSAAQRGPSSARFIRSSAESLPFARSTFNLVTVSMAFHWFDQRQFLAEAARVLAPGGELWVYNLLFPGVLSGDAAYSGWHRDRYLEQYPVPARHAETLASQLRQDRLSLEFSSRQKLAYEVDFTAIALRGYLTTQSNIEAALRRGAALSEVDAWLDAELAPFFREAENRSFTYVGYAEVAVAR